ncbi:hypothetical protein Q7P37_010907 [Cladosporium fusiforme]
MPTNDEAEKPVWYFGYGSNMKSSVMSSRKIEPLEICPVKIPDYILTFDVFGLPYSEPAMASISRYAMDDLYSQSRVPCAHGIAYRLSTADMRRLIATEGGGVAYRLIEVEGILLSDNGPGIKLRTLVARYPRRPNAAPSARYRKLLIEGAEEHGLPIEYQAYLCNLPVFVPGSSCYSRLGALLFLWVGRRIVGVMARWVKRAMDVNGQCPRWYRTVIWLAYSAMWLWHDWVHAIAFGRGDGGGIIIRQLIPVEDDINTLSKQGIGITCTPKRHLCTNTKPEAMVPSKTDEHGHVHADPGPMYTKPWVQKLIQQIQQVLHAQAEAGWLDIDQIMPQRVLDYACGNGTVSRALLKSLPNATFRGLDIATSQVKRFNDEAARLSPAGKPSTRMLAIQGDLNDPQAQLAQPEWFDFDAAIVSMALHHVQDPVELLKRLRQRVRCGGSVIVIDWLQQSDHDASTDKHEARMTRLSEGPSIWPGFSMDDIKNHFSAAGCTDIDVVVYSEPIEAPTEMQGYSRMFIAKAKVASSDDG